MTTKHTPGPWTYQYDRNGMRFNEISCYVDNGYEEYEADARLIAAAPENTESNIYMTSVVEKCIKVINDYLPSPMMSEEDTLNAIIGILDNAEIVEKLKASKSAIAKATNQKEEAI